jgi:hypothetical protein
MTTPHRTRLILRGHQLFAPRDPDISRMYVASEDTHACEKYLLAMQAAGLIDPARIEVLPLPTLDGHSTLAAVLKRLDDERAEPGIRLGSDEYWAVFDVDRQSAEYLDAQAQIATERDYRLAGSNPCFELWLLLHLTADIRDLPRGQDDRGAADKCARRLHTTLQAGDPRARGYNKAKPGAERFTSEELVDLACQRAHELSPDPTPWPATVGTHMHRLIERLPRPRRTA